MKVFLGFLQTRVTPAVMRFHLQGLDVCAPHRVQGFGVRRQPMDNQYGLHQASFKRVRSTGSGIRIGGYEGFEVSLNAGRSERT